MSTYYCVRYINGMYVPGWTTNGIDFYPIPQAAHKLPKPAVRFAEMRELNVSPLRAPGEASGAPFPDVSPGPLTGTEPRSGG